MGGWGEGGEEGGLNLVISGNPEIKFIADRHLFKTVFAPLGNLYFLLPGHLLSPVTQHCVLFFEPKVERLPGGFPPPEIRASVKR